MRTQQLRILYLPRPEHTALVFTPYWWKRLRRRSEVVEWDHDIACTSENLAERLSEFDALVTAWGSPRLTDQVLQKATRLKLIAHAAGSVKFMLSPEVVQRYLIPRGVRVFSGNGAIALNVAEATVGMMIMGVRLWIDHILAYRERGVWRDPAIAVNGQYLLGSTVGLVSCSTVAREVIRLLRPFRTRILVYDPFLPLQEARRMRLKPVDLRTLFRESHIVSVHTPLLPETVGLIHREHLSLLREHSVLVNTSRGAVIDHEALVEEARTGRFIAVLDVTDPEPLPPDHPLRELPNVIILPHIAGAGFYGYHRIGELLVKATEAVVREEPFEGEVPLQLYERIA
ncbi:MAG: hydroxyacid dehydrogenase [Armatimonadota bacterium]|nr:hydroxyacid dehydrogenase [bacterium]MDW8320743.1 hydroxyacid dehydrogenase [Armatimonadota bacterium]